MEENKKQSDPRLDTPSEANREKHINFLEVEEQGNAKRDEEVVEQDRRRKEQWQEGLREGEKAND